MKRPAAVIALGLFVLAGCASGPRRSSSVPSQLFTSWLLVKCIRYTLGGYFSRSAAR